MIDYPEREPFFAMRFLRLLTKSAAAMHIGADGCMLLMIIVGQEDSCRYSRPVSFWNHQLAALLGLRGVDEHALRRVRERCVKAGWLQYAAGNKQLPARYFVTIPAVVSTLPDSSSDENPENYEGSQAHRSDEARTTLGKTENAGKSSAEEACKQNQSGTKSAAVNALPDGSSDESPEEYRANPAAIPAQKRQESGENPARIRRESGENPAPSSPNPIPNPIPKSAAAPPPAPEQAAAADPLGMGSIPPAPTPPPVPPGDWIDWKRSRRIYISRSDESGNLDDWRDLFRTAGPKIMAEAYAALIPAIPPPKGVGYVAMQRWIFDHYQEQKL